MVKSELVQQICNIYSNLKYRDVKMMIDIIFNEIENAMTKGMHCEFREFGTFKVKYSKMLSQIVFLTSF